MAKSTGRQGTAGAEYPAFASVDDWCRISGLSRTRTYALLTTGNLIARKIGGRTFVDVKAGLEFMHAAPRVTAHIGSAAHTEAAV